MTGSIGAVADRPRHFFIIGCQRSGTTALAEFLARHPGVRMARPIRPEPKFFLHPDSDHASPDDYRRSVFGPVSPGQLLGEKSTGYVESPESQRRIARTFPDARVVCLIRDPILRALSNLDFSTANGLEREPARAALVREIRGRPVPMRPPGVSVSPFTYLARGRYDEYLGPARARFGSRLLVIQTEQLARLTTLTRLREHLGVPAHDARLLAPDAEEESQIDRLPRALRRELQAYFRRSIEALLEIEGIDMDLGLWPSWSS